MSIAESQAPAPVATGPSTPECFGWPALIAEPFLEQITARLNLTDTSPDGLPHHTMRHPTTGESTGAVRVYRGDGLQAAVLSTASTPMLRMWQLVAFTPPTSAVPHLSFDAKANPGGCWFSIDLVPRVACTEEPAWTEYVYEPLSDLVWSVHERDDMRQSLLRARHRMGLSPWLISMRIDEVSGVSAAIEAVAQVTDRFCELVADGIPPEVAPSLTPQQLAARDDRERELLYSWEATANYRYLAMIGGDESVDIVQQTLRHPVA